MEKISLDMLTKSCGECDVCCRVLEVRELGKPEYTDCAHRKKGGGCGIWTDPSRPDVCGSWNCAFLYGWIPDHLRPDKSGVMLYPVAAHQTPAGLAHLAGQEVWAGALDSPAGQELFQNLSRKMLTVVRIYGTQIFRAAGPNLEIWKQRVGFDE